MGRKLGTDYGRPLELEELFELTLGPNGESAFPSESDREAAWDCRRDDLMEHGAPPAR